MCLIDETQTAFILSAKTSQYQLTESPSPTLFMAQKTQAPSPLKRLCLSCSQGSHLLQPPRPASVPLIHHAVREAAHRRGGNQHVRSGVRRTNRTLHLSLCSTGWAKTSAAWPVLKIPELYWKRFWSFWMYSMCVTVTVLCVSLSCEGLCDGAQLWRRLSTYFSNSH